MEWIKIDQVDNWMVIFLKRGVKILIIERKFTNSYENMGVLLKFSDENNN